MDQSTNFRPCKGVVLDFNDSSTLQCACENLSNQAEVSRGKPRERKEKAHAIRGGLGGGLAVIHANFG